MLKLLKSKGLTLVEVLGSVLLFMIATLGLFSVYVQSGTVSKRAEYAYNAYHLAKNHVERLKTVSFEELQTAGETDTALDKDGHPNINGEFVRSTAVVPNYAGYSSLTQVAVSVSYRFKGVLSGSPMQIVTVIFNGG
ncbi:MAG: type II secretion system protein [Candidatus Omnitrophica bacterium]|nr:type II secretion system protein [Candidatus Omnitrophota bacterium]